MTPDLTISNLALGHLKGRYLTQCTTADSVEVTEILRHWQTAVEETLKPRDWTFATVVLLLTEVTYDNLDATGFLFSYDYPPDCLALWRVYSEGTVDKKKGEDYRVVYDPTTGKRVILTNTEDAYCEYTYSVPTTADAWVTLTVYAVGEYVLQNSIIYQCLTAHTAAALFATDLAAAKWIARTYDPALFSADFKMALSYRLAAAMSPVISADDKVTVMLMAAFNNAISESKRLDSSQDTGVVKQKSKYKNARA